MFPLKIYYTNDDKRPAFWETVLIKELTKTAYGKSPRAPNTYRTRFSTRSKCDGFSDSSIRQPESIYEIKSEVLRGYPRYRVSAKESVYC